MMYGGRCIRALGAGIGAMVALGVAPAVVFGQTEEEAAPRYQIQDLGELGGTLTKAMGISSQGVVVGQAESVKDNLAIRGWTASMWGSPSYFDPDAGYARRTLISPLALAAWIFVRRQVPNDFYVFNYDGAGRRVANTAERELSSSEEAVVFGGRGPQAIGSLGGGKSMATAINASGQIVGTSLADAYGGPTRAFLYQSDGRLQDLGTLGGRTSIAYDINDRGQVVGEADLGGGVQRGFLWEGGRMRDLGTLGGSQSSARAVNESGQVVGWTENRRFETCAFVWEAGQMRELERGTGNRAAYALAVNDMGHAVGKVETASGATQAALWDRRGRLASLTFGSGLRSEANAINNHAEVVGTAEVNKDKPVAFLWRNRRFYDLNTFLPSDSGWRLVSAQSINDRGEIIGWGEKDGKTRAFLLVPTGQ